MLCVLLTLGLVVLFMLIFLVWKIHKIRSEEGWIHQPFGFKKVKRF